MPLRYTARTFSTPLGRRVPCSPLPKVMVVFAASSFAVTKPRLFGLSQASEPASSHSTLSTYTCSVLCAPSAVGAATNVSGGCLSVNDCRLCAPSPLPSTSLRVPPCVALTTLP